MKYKLINKLVNLTPHEVVIFEEDGVTQICKLPSQGSARVKTESVEVGIIRDIPIRKQTYGEVEGLPEQKENTYYIVSMLVKQALPDRDDLLSPDTSPSGAVRDSENRIIGVKGFSI
ncbi:hypothetical protein BH753_gp043 [Bacillus phage Shbh1]|uniref:Uncharacterized protein n=1 Tax=Bacillus phage Shbh1 TaxID=1796992 RepID=A0A142F168_9CAUD|nr:hypothetical protein BH753_gp043 [Bacillus phage Shbh1]AMQ66525.1 hypothetical protein [Bacillus phage Shbh1]